MNYNDLDLMVLKGIFSNKKNALDFAYDGSPKYFSSDLFKFVKLVIDYIKVYKEIPTKNVLIDKANVSKNEHLIKYIGDVFNIIDNVQANESEYKHYLEKIKERHIESLLNKLKSQLSSEDEEGDVDINSKINKLQSTLNYIKNVNSVKAYAQKSLKEGISDFRNRYMAKARDSSYGLGLQTGINFFDFTTGGLRNQEYFIVAGPTGGGKSLVLGQVAKNLWMNGNTLENFEKGLPFKEGNDIVYYSLEMPYDDMFERVLANLASIPQKSIRDATLTEEEKKRLSLAVKFIESYPSQFHIVDIARGATMESMELIFNDITASTGRKPKVIVVDYLSLMSYNNPNGKDLADWLIQGAISEQLAEFGRVNDVNVLTAVQLTNDDPKNRGAESMGTHRLSRSKMIGHNANFILMIEKRQNESELPDFILHMVKSRRTELGKGRLYKKLDCCQLLNEPPDNLYSDDVALDFSSDGENNQND